MIIPVINKKKKTHIKLKESILSENKTPIIPAGTVPIIKKSNNFALNLSSSVFSLKREISMFQQ